MSPSSRGASPRGLVAAVYVVFFISGALGLVYEVLWLRKLLLVFGSTVHATSTILTVFFGGLALGSWLFGRLIDRFQTAGLRWYAWCEGGIGLYALATPWLFELAKAVYIPVYRASGYAPGALVGASFLCSAAILLLPTVLMGGTFPILSRFLIRAAEEKGVRIAALYGVNTFGAMTGTLLVYYLGLQTLGWTVTLQCAALLNLTLGVCAHSLDRNLRQAGFHTSHPARASSTATAKPLSRELRVLLIAFGLSGFSAMVYEVAWTRALSLVLGSSIYAFCLMLAAFLGGIGVGSVLARMFLARRSARLMHFAIIEILLGVYGLFSIGLFCFLPEGFVKLWPLFGKSFAGLSALQASLSLLVMMVPTVLMGFLFPLVSDLATARLSSLGRQLGTVYAINTFGGILGSALAGFWLIPWLGVAGSLMAAGLVNVVAAIAVAFEAEPFETLWRRLVLIVVSLTAYAATALGVFLPAWREHQAVMVAGVFNDPSLYPQGVMNDQRNWTLLFYRDSLNTTVSVHRNRRTNELFLKVGGKTDASTGLDMPTQLLTGHLPMLLRPNATRALVIGLGSGVTLGSVGRHPVTTLDCAEIEPAVIEGARLFREYNNAIHDDPRVRFFAADGRNVLLARPQQYDVIISEPSNPWMAGVATLFTKEFYGLAKSRLAPGGVMCQWLQLYRFFPSDVKLVLKTFHDAFPYVTVWSTIPGDLALIGSMEPLRLSPEALERAFAQPAIRDDLARASITHPRALLETFYFDSETVERLTADTSWLHQDDRLDLEFSAPRALYMDSTIKVNYQGLDAFRAPRERVTGVPDAPEDLDATLALATVLRARSELDKERLTLEQALERLPNEAVLHLRLGELYARRGWLSRAETELRRARKLEPSSAAAAAALGRLLWQQDRQADALPLLAEAVELAPGDSALTEEVGVKFGAAKQYEQAVAYLQAAVQAARPPMPEQFAKLAEALKELERWNEMSAAALEGWKLAPTDPVFRSLLGEAAMARGELSDAHQWFREALQLASEDARNFFNLGRLAERQGDAAAARNFFKAGLRYDPYNIETLDRLRALNSSERPPS